MNDPTPYEYRPDFDPLPQTVAQIQSDVMLAAQTWCHSLLPTRTKIEEQMARTLNNTDDEPEYTETGVYGSLYLQGALEYLEARVQSTIMYEADFMSGLYKYHPEWFNPKPQNPIEEEWVEDWLTDEMGDVEMTSVLAGRRFQIHLEAALIQTIDDLQVGRLALVFDADADNIEFIEIAPIPSFLREEALLLVPE